MWLAAANHCGSMRSPTLSSGYNIRVFWWCELLLRPISRTGILFIPMTPLQQTIKARMCNSEITAVGFNNLSQCRLCEFWLWLLQHCKWCLNVCCHFLGEHFMYFPSAAFKIESLENKTATLTSPELLWIIDSGITFWIITIATVVYL